MVYEHPQFPAELKAEMYTWVRANATEERKPKDTEEQFIYKARKKAIGPFKQKMWSLPEDARRAIGQSLEDQFTFLMTKLKINDTAAAVAKFVSGAADRASIATPRSSPRAARSPRRRRKQKAWPTDRVLPRPRRHEEHEDARRKLLNVLLRVVFVPFVFSWLM